MSEGIQLDNSEVLIIGSDHKERSEQLLRDQEDQRGVEDDTTKNDDDEKGRGTRNEACPLDDSEEDLPTALVAFLEAEHHDGCTGFPLDQETRSDHSSMPSSTKEAGQILNQRRQKRPFAQSTLEGDAKAEAIAEIIKTEEEVGEATEDGKKNANVPKTHLRASANLSSSLRASQQVGAHAIGGSGSRRRMRHSTTDFSSGSLRDSKNNYRNLLLEDEDIRDLISGDLHSGPIVPAKLIRGGTENDELYDDTLDAHLQIRKEHRHSVTAQLVINQQALMDEDESMDPPIAEEPVSPVRNDSIQTAVRESMNDGSPEEQSTAVTDSSTKGRASWKCISVLFGWWRTPSSGERGRFDSTLLE
jgi:hypothetical protein